MDSKPLQSDRRQPDRLTRLLMLGTLVMAGVAVWFRFRALGHIPGVNGDEAWYGVQALEMLRDRSFWVRTPTGNPANPFYLGPLVVLHAWFPPSVVLLRSVAVASGVMTLVVNWLLCRWVFDRTTATVSTMMLAVWPVMIASSRFGWDTSQSVLATLPVVYLSLAMIRFPQRRVRLGVLAVVSLLMAIWVHPTNLFAGAMMIASGVAWMRSHGMGKQGYRRIALSAVLLVVLVVSLVGCGIGDDTAQRWLSRARGIEDMLQRGGLWHVPSLLARLHTGATTFRYIPGSQSWLEWPASKTSLQWGVDVVLFWGALVASGLMLCQTDNRSDRTEDRGLLAGWVITLVVYLVVAGPSSLLPGWERYAMCLIGPTTLVLTRGAVLVYAACPKHQRLLVSTAVLGGSLLLADFQIHYFQFFQQTAGEAHHTFRTGPIEPRVVALDLIGTQIDGNTTTTWIVTSDWWNYWTMAYLASRRSDFRVVRWKEVESDPLFRSALADGRVWLIEFAESRSKQSEQIVPTIPSNFTLKRWEVRGYMERPVLVVLQVTAQKKVSFQDQPLDCE